MIDGRVCRLRRRLRTKTKVAGVAIGLAVLTLSFLAYSFYPIFQNDWSFVATSTGASESAVASDLLNAALVAKKDSTAQVVFPYSVIPGGARSRSELSEAARREPVVAAHYAGFSVADARVIRLPHDKLAYVSYRLGNRIYWTKTKVGLHQGEAVLSDGKHLARARCGNRISEVAMAPVSPHEPAGTDLSTPIVQAHANVDPALLASVPIWPESSAAPVLTAMRDLPAVPAPGPGFPPFLPTFCCGRKSSLSTPSSSSYPLPQPGYPAPLSVTTPESSTFLLLLSSLVLLPFVIHARRMQ
jgi:hypothetical protein